MCKGCKAALTGQEGHRSISTSYSEREKSQWNSSTMPFPTGLTRWPKIRSLTNRDRVRRGVKGTPLTSCGIGNRSTHSEGDFCIIWQTWIFVGFFMMKYFESLKKQGTYSKHLCIRYPEWNMHMNDALNVSPSHRFRLFPDEVTVLNVAFVILVLTYLCMCPSTKSLNST